MKIPVTDLEQIEQFNKFYIQLGTVLKQVQSLQAHIYMAEVWQEQHEIGAENIQVEDVDALRAQLIISLKSLRNRSRYFIEDMMDITKRATRGREGAGTPKPVPAPNEEDRPVEAVTEVARGNGKPPAKKKQPQPESELEFNVINE